MTRATNGAIARRGPARRRTAPAAALAVLVIASVALLLCSSAHLSPRVAPNNPPPLPGALIWSADLETGDLSQWNQGQFGESVFNSGTGEVSVSSELAHSGRYALRLSISGASGETQAARILRWHLTPEEGYYSVWLDFPQRYRPDKWWNVVQIKSVGVANVPVWVLNVGNRPDGTMYFYLWDAVHKRSYAPLKRVSIPVRRWTQVTLYLRRAGVQTGRIAIWQDGELLFDLDQVQTAVGPNLHWGIGNYTDDIVPDDAVIYADDAEIRSVVQPGTPSLTGSADSNP